MDCVDVGLGKHPLQAQLVLGSDQRVFRRQSSSPQRRPSQLSTRQMRSHWCEQRQDDMLFAGWANGVQLRAQRNSRHHQMLRFVWADSSVVVTVGFGSESRSMLEVFAIPSSIGHDKSVLSTVPAQTFATWDDWCDVRESSSVPSESCWGEMEDSNGDAGASVAAPSRRGAWQRSTRTS